MQPGTETIRCPRCGALSGERQFCQHCGQALPLPLAANPAASPTPYGMPVAQPEAPAPPPLYPPLSNPPPGAAPYGVASVPTPGLPRPPKRGLRSRPVVIIALVVGLLVLLGGGVSGFFWVQHLLRHGLPDNIPLPDRASYVGEDERAISLGNDHRWYFTVEDTTPAQMIAFYKDQLVAKGWGSPLDNEQPDFSDIAATKYGPVELVDVIVSDTPRYGISPPAGGVVLTIALITSPHNGVRAGGLGMINVLGTE